MNMAIDRNRESKKGFTLVELLVVVAIIAILVAVSIPIFTGKLNEAKEAVDKANERALKAVMAEAVLTGEITYFDPGSKGYVTQKFDDLERGSTSTAVFYYTEDGTLSVTIDFGIDKVYPAPENVCKAQSDSGHKKGAYLAMQISISTVKEMPECTILWIPPHSNN